MSHSKVDFFKRVKEEYLPLLGTLEGDIPFMYLDTEGNVSIGIGHKITQKEMTSQKKDEKFPFPFYLLHYHKSPHHKQIRLSDITITNTVVDHAKVQTTYSYVHACKKGEPPIDYFDPQHNHIGLKEKDRKSLAVGDINRNILPVIQKHFPNFFSYPEKVQFGILDIYYNSKETKFIQFRLQVQQQNWVQAGLESLRNVEKAGKGIIPRSILVATWFFQAASNDLQFSNTLTEIELAYETCKNQIRPALPRKRICKFREKEDTFQDIIDDLKLWRSGNARIDDSLEGLYRSLELINKLYSGASPVSSMCITNPYAPEVK